jgi:hypothetical protein
MTHSTHSVPASSGLSIKTFCTLKHFALDTLRGKGWKIDSPRSMFSCVCVCGMVACCISYISWYVLPVHSTLHARYTFHIPFMHVIWSSRGGDGMLRFLTTQREKGTVSVAKPLSALVWGIAETNVCLLCHETNVCLLCHETNKHTNVCLYGDASPNHYLPI